MQLFTDYTLMNGVLPNQRDSLFSTITRTLLLAKTFEEVLKLNEKTEKVILFSVGRHRSLKGGFIKSWLLIGLNGDSKVTSQKVAKKQLPLKNLKIKEKEEVISNLRQKMMEKGKMLWFAEVAEMFYKQNEEPPALLLENLSVYDRSAAWCEEKADVLRQVFGLCFEDIFYRKRLKGANRHFSDFLPDENFVYGGGLLTRLYPGYTLYDEDFLLILADGSSLSLLRGGKSYE